MDRWMDITCYKLLFVNALLSCLKQKNYRCVNKLLSYSQTLNIRAVINIHRTSLSATTPDTTTSQKFVIMYFLMKLIYRLYDLVLNLSEIHQSPISLSPTFLMIPSPATRPSQSNINPLTLEIRSH